MSTAEIIDAAVEGKGVYFLADGQTLFKLSKGDLKDFATRIAQQAMAERSRHLPENAARLIIESYLKDMLGDIPLPCYSMEKQGEGENGKHSWAFWVNEPDESPHEQTSWVSEDGRIEWGGSTWISEKLESVAKQQESAPVLPELTRYEPERYDEDRVRMYADSDGDYVKYSDALAAIAAGGAK